MPRVSQTLSLSLPPKLSREADLIAKRENRTRSELFREALRQYIVKKRWEQVREWGADTAARSGIKEADIPAIIKSIR